MSLDIDIDIDNQLPIFNIIIRYTSINKLNKCIESIKLQEYPKEYIHYYVITNNKEKNNKKKIYKIYDHMNHINDINDNKINTWNILLDDSSIFYNKNCLDKISKYILKHENSIEYYYTWKYHTGQCISIFDYLDECSLYFNCIAFHSSHTDIIDFDLDTKCFDMSCLFHLFTQISINCVLTHNQNLPAQICFDIDEDENNCDSDSCDNELDTCDNDSCNSNDSSDSDDSDDSNYYNKNIQINIPKNTENIIPINGHIRAYLRAKQIDKQHDIDPIQIENKNILAEKVYKYSKRRLFFNA
jgi:hypothetical protein